MMRVPLFIFALAFGGSAWGTTSIRIDKVTPQQIIAVVTTDQANCNAAGSLVVYEGTSAIGSVIDDVNGTLFTDADKLDSRPSSLVIGSSHTGVIGLRRAQRASDGKFYSRSPQTSKSHLVQATCGSDTVSIITGTSNVPMGSTYAENVRYDANNPFGYAWPTFNFADKSQRYIDPTTGILYKRLTGLEDLVQVGMGPSTPTSACIVAYAATGWTNPQNGCGAGSLAVSTGTAPLFVALAAVLGTDNTTARPPSWSVFNSEAVDDLKIRIHGNSSTGAAHTVDIAISLDGGATDWSARMPVTLPASIGDTDYPSGTLVPFFSEWVSGNLQTPPNTPDMAQRTGTVICTGANLLWHAGNSFNVTQWKANTHITIAGDGDCTPGDYLLADVPTDLQMVLSTSAGTGAAASTYTVNSFGLNIYPTSALVPVTIDHVTSMITGHYQFTGAASGDGQYVNNNTKTTAGGVEGWIATFPNFSGAYAGYFIPRATTASGNNIGEARMIWSQWSNIIADSPAGDGVFLTQLGTISGGQFTDFDDPNTFYYAGDVLSRPGEKSLGKCVYDAATANYDKYDQPFDSAQSANVHCTNLTPHSVGGTLTERMVAFDARYDPTWVGVPTMVNTRSGYIILSAGGQNDFNWTIVTNTAGNVVAMEPSYATASCRFCLWHSYGDGGGTLLQWAAEGTKGSGRTTTLYQSPILQINGSAGGTLTTTASAPTCPGVDPSMTAYLPFGSGCDLVKFSGHEPCANGAPAGFPTCSWNGGLKGLKLTSTSSGTGQALALGDTIFDDLYGDYGATSEIMLLVGSTAADTFWVLRNYAPASGPFHNIHFSIIQAHAANFTADMGSGKAPAAAELWWDFVADPHGEAMITDATYYPSAHGDDSINPASSGISAKIRNEFAGFNLAYSIRTGALATEINQQQNIGSSPNPSAETGGLFGGVKGAGLRYGYADSHPSTQAAIAPVGEQTFISDGVKPGAFAYLTAGNPVAGSSLVGTINPLTVASVAGSTYLYKVSGYVLQADLNIKYRPILMWVGVHAIRDISGPSSAIGNTSASWYQDCYAYKNDECVTGSTAGDLFLNAPGLTTDGTCANNSYQIATSLGSAAEMYGNYPCVIVNAPEIDNVNQLDYGHGAFSNGERVRMITHPARAFFGSTAFFGARNLPDGSGTIFSCDWCGNVRSDLYWAKLPAMPPVSAVDRSGYVNIPVTVPAGADARIQFGYLEFGGPTDYYCGPRQEACATDSTPPFAYATSDTAHYTSCSSGCTINVPVIPSHVAYYAIQRMGSSVGTLAGIIADGEESPGTPTTPGTLIRGNVLNRGGLETR